MTRSAKGRAARFRLSPGEFWYQGAKHRRVNKSVAPKRQRRKRR